MKASFPRLCQSHALIEQTNDGCFLLCISSASCNNSVVGVIEEHIYKIYKDA